MSHLVIWARKARVRAMNLRLPCDSKKEDKVDYLGRPAFGASPCLMMKMRWTAWLPRLCRLLIIWAMW